METAVFFYKQLKKTAVFQRPFKFYLLIFSHMLLDMFQTVKKLIHCERKGSGNKAFPEFNPQAEFISAEENPVFLRPDKVQGFPQK